MDNDDCRTCLIELSRAVRAYLIENYKEDAPDPTPTEQALWDALYRAEELPKC